MDFDPISSTTPRVIVFCFFHKGHITWKAKVLSTVLTECLSFKKME